MVIFVRGNATCSMHDTKIFKRPPVRGGVDLPGSASPFFNAFQRPLISDVLATGLDMPSRSGMALATSQMLPLSFFQLWAIGTGGHRLAFHSRHTIPCIPHALKVPQRPWSRKQLTELCLILAVMLDLGPINILKSSLFMEIRTVVQVMTFHALVPCF